MPIVVTTAPTVTLMGLAAAIAGVLALRKAPDPIAPVRLGQRVVDPIRLADQVEAHFAEHEAVAIAGLLGGPAAIVDEDGMDLVTHCFE